MTTAFSGLPDALACVDCGATAEWLVRYIAYEIGDVTCDAHAARRLRIIPAHRLPIPEQVWIDGYEEAA